MAAEELISEFYDEEILIIIPSGGRISFKAVTGVVIGREKTTPKHKTERGFEVGDHIFRNPVKMSLTLTLLRGVPGEADEVSVMESLFGRDYALTVATSVGVFQNMVVQTTNYDRGQTQDTIKATVTLEEIKTAVSKVSTVDLSTLPEADIPGNTDAKNPGTLNEGGIEKTDNSSWLDKILNMTGFVTNGGVK